VTVERVADRDRALSHRGLPVDGAGRGDLDLAEDDVDEAVDDVLLAGDVVVERHRLHAQLARHLAHRERVEAAVVGELERRLEHPVPRQWGTPSWSHA
jgi:hypothetical protein